MPLLHKLLVKVQHKEGTPEDWYESTVPVYKRLNQMECEDCRPINLVTERSIQ